MWLRKGDENMTQEIRVYGIVQGVGFRPFVHRLAEAHGLSGRVANVGPYVEIVARGTEAVLLSFRADLRSRAPERAQILRVEVRPSAEETASNPRSRSARLRVVERI